ncbi:hypothetical protein SAMN05421690_100635 [Nitrosomonas sp. Nm51]|nr:hypothetical protein SAMN05421690_100635 [Nitrosomonas sp. Nm51]
MAQILLVYIWKEISLLVFFSSIELARTSTMTTRNSEAAILLLSISGFKLDALIIHIDALMYIIKPTRRRSVLGAIVYLNLSARLAMLSNTFSIRVKR